MTSKKGFTLVEMVVTIAIILILTSTSTIVVSDMLNRTRSAEAQVQEHIDMYEVAKSQVDGQLPAGYAPPTGTTAPSSAATGLPTSPTTTVETTAAQPESPTAPKDAPPLPTDPTTTPTTATPTTAAPTTATPTTATPTTATPTTTAPVGNSITVGTYTTPAITGIPEAFPNTTTATFKGWGEYEYNAVFTIPKASHDQYVAIYLPPGTINLIEWYSCKLEAFDASTNIAVISVAAYNDTPAIRVDYSGAKKDWSDTRVYDVAPK